MGLLAQHNLSSRALTLLQDAAAGAYCTALGLDYHEKRDEILGEIIAGFEANAASLKSLIERASFAGITSDTAFVPQMITVYATDMALRAAAKVCGEPPAKKAEEAKPEAAAVH